MQTRLTTLSQRIKSSISSWLGLVRKPWNATATAVWENGSNFEMYEQFINHFCQRTALPTNEAEDCWNPRWDSGRESGWNWTALQGLDEIILREISAMGGVCTKHLLTSLLLMTGLSVAKCSVRNLQDHHINSPERSKESADRRRRESFRPIDSLIFRTSLATRYYKLLKQIKSLFLQTFTPQTHRHQTHLSHFLPKLHQNLKIMTQSSKTETSCWLGKIWSRGTEELNLHHDPDGSVSFLCIYPAVSCGLLF